MARWCRILAFAACGLFVLLTVLPSAQSSLLQPAQSTTPQTKVPAPDATRAGTGSITGLVVAADNGAPVKRVVVTVTGGTPINPATGRSAGTGTPGLAATAVLTPRDPASQGLPAGVVTRQVVTDTAGRFSVSGLPAGRFSVMVSISVGFVRPQSESVQVAEGGAATVTLRLERTGAITGKVFDEDGDPLPRAILRATRWESVGGARRLVAAGGGSTPAANDLGEYRLYDLPPGEYFVAASYPSYAPVSSFQPVESQEPLTGFAPTFYPGSASMEGAQAVAVRSGQDTPGVNISLLRARMGRITGTVVDSAGAPMSQRGMVAIVAKLNAYQVGSGISRRPDGTFVSGDVAPGEYYVYATETRGEGPEASREAVGVPVSVNGDEVAVQLQMNAGATVSGKVLIEGTPTGSMPGTVTTSGINPARVSVSARLVVTPVPWSSVGRASPVADDGTFMLTGLRGTLRIVATGSRAALKSVRSGGRDILATPIELIGTERITDVEVVMTTDTANVEGRVTNTRGEPAAGAFVILFSDDPARRFEGSPYVRLVRAGAQSEPTTPSPGGMQGVAPLAARIGPGRFTTPTLLPGRYGIVAFESGNTIPAYDAEALQKLQARATFVTLTAGETATVQVQILRQ